MAKAQAKKVSGARKKVAPRAVARVKSAVSATKKKVVARKPAKPARPVKKAAAPVKKAAPKPVRKARPKPAPKPARKPAPKTASKAIAKPASKAIAKAAPKSAAKSSKAAKGVKPVRTAPKAVAKRPVSKAVAAVRSVAKAVKKVVAKVVKPTPPVTKKPGAVAPPAFASPLAPKVPAPAAEKKRTRRPRLRITSNGAPAAAWLTNEKPRPASFIPAPPRAEAPSAVAAPPASSDRLIRPEDVSETAVRTVPVRVDIEQGAGRFYVIPNPPEVTLRAGEGIEWDFRYLGGADVNVDEVIIEFDHAAPFQSNVFRTRKPGGARPHRQMSGAAKAAPGKRIEYIIRAMTAFKSEVARAKVAVTVND